VVTNERNRSRGGGGLQVGGGPGVTVGGVKLGLRDLGY